MAKLKSKEECAKIAETVMDQYPKIKSVHVTEDGQAFLGDKKSAADLHARTYQKGKVLQVFEFESPKAVEPTTNQQESEDSKLTYKELMESIKTSEDVELLKVFATDHRKSVVAAANERLKALEDNN